MIYDLPPPAIIQRAEPWELDLYRKLAPLGLPRSIRHEIVAELKRLEGQHPSVVNPTLADLARYGKDPALAHILSLSVGWPKSFVEFNLSFVDHTFNVNNLTTYTFSGRALGAADTNRYVVVGASGSLATVETIDSITVQGLSGSEVVTTIGATNERGSLWIINVPTGTTGDIVVTFSNTMNRCGIAVWRLVTSNSTATATASDNTITANALSASLAIPTGGGGIGYICGRNGSPRTWAWTNLTEEAGSDETIEGAFSHSAASSITAGTSTRTATASGTIAGAALVMAAWA